MHAENVRLTEKDRRWLQRYAKRLAIAAGLDGANLSIAIVGDVLMRRLHRRYLKTPTTTDVLTFDLSEPDDAQRQAEIVICCDLARRVARRLRHPARLEMLLYILHGLLHLSGYDDVRKTLAQRMHHRENELLTEAGLPAISVPVLNSPRKKPRRP